MRSSKSRSRSKQNRPRTIGNIVNRVFDSSGPEGKVRGTPQQIIEKYQALARDAQLSNDRVAAENFLQHAEHYTRMLGEAMREMAAEQEARRQFQGQNGNGSHQGNGNQGGERPWQQNRRDERVSEEQPEIGAVPVFPFDEAEVSAPEVGLVETPEGRAPAEPAPAPVALATEDQSAAESVAPVQREPRAEGDRPARAKREGGREGREERRPDARREGRRKEERRPEERRSREAAPAAEAEGAAAEADAPAARSPRPRRAPATRSRKAPAEVGGAPGTESEG